LASGVVIELPERLSLVAEAHGKGQTPQTGNTTGALGSRRLLVLFGLIGAAQLSQASVAPPNRPYASA